MDISKYILLTRKEVINNFVPSNKNSGNYFFVNLNTTFTITKSIFEMCIKGDIDNLKFFTLSYVTEIINPIELKKIYYHLMDLYSYTKGEEEIIHKTK